MAWDNAECRIGQCGHDTTSQVFTERQTVHFYGVGIHTIVPQACPGFSITKRHYATHALITHLDSGTYAEFGCGFRWLSGLDPNTVEATEREGELLGEKGTEIWPRLIGAVNHEWFDDDV